ncbi:MAG: hypothetical protein LBP62_08355 [Clostridiales bacterium]|jgi:hypothetical protein|nr:hypothetical protein [Clostridiales bacterium]
MWRNFRFAFKISCFAAALRYSMDNLEKMKLFYEDIFGASVFWDDLEPNTTRCLKIFVDDFRGYDILKMIDEALKRPIRIIQPEELTCVPHDELGYIKITENLSDEFRYCIRHTGYIPYELSAYVDYFLDADISNCPNGKEIKCALDNYFKMRKVN